MTTKLVLELPWPEKSLFPNRRTHWAALAKARKDARETAREISLMTAWEMPEAARIEIATQVKTTALPVEWTFCYPTNARRDRDNLLAACKAYQDGIADALGIDDTIFEPIVLRRGDVLRGGKVIVTIG